MFTLMPDASCLMPIPDVPLCLPHAKGRTWLKWHRGRMRASDFEFDPVRILQGLRCGASVEIDIRRHAGGGFAVLHDETLEQSTTGQGAVAETGADRLRSLRRRDNAGRPTEVEIALLGDLCQAIAAQPIGPGALLQLDLKETSATLSAEDIGAFTRDVAEVQQHLILSGGDAQAVRALAEALPGMQIGHDPCHDGARAALALSGEDRLFVETALSEAGRAQMIYLEIGLIFDALERGFDLIGAFHEAGRRVDAYTVARIAPETVGPCRRLVDLGVDQITTDDPEGLFRQLSQPA